MENFLNLMRLFALRPSAAYHTCFAAIPWMEWILFQDLILSPLALRRDGGHVGNIDMYGT
jgi:hypothetical protein